MPWDESIDLRNPISHHPDNRGLRAAFVAPPARVGAALWPDLGRRRPPGVLAGGPTWAPAPSGGMAVVLDGSNDYVGLNAPLIPASGDWTIAASFLAASLSSVYVIVGQRSGGGGRLIWYLLNTGTVQPQIDGGGGEPFVGANVVSVGRWYRYALTRRGNVYTQWANGVFDGSGTRTMDIDVSVNTAIGSGANGDVFLPFNGRIADVRFYTRAVDAGWAARDYRWSRDPSRDPRFNRVRRRRWFLAGEGGDVFTASATFSVGAATLASAATFSPGTKTATAALTVGPTALAASATFSPGTKTATAALTAGPAALAASATFASGTNTATATLTVGAATLAASAAFTAPVYTASAGLTAGATTLAATAVFATAVYQAAAGLTTGKATLAASATFAAPVYSASAPLTVGRATLAATATVTNPTYTAVAALTTGRATLAAVASFTTVTRTAAVTLTAGAATLAASATRTVPTFTAAAALVTGKATLAAAALFADTIAVATAPLTVGGVTLAAVTTFVISLPAPSASDTPAGTWVLRDPGTIWVLRDPGTVWVARP